jgi:flagellar hook-associated protein 2
VAISSPGLGSGLNIGSIVSQLVAVESQPVQLLQKKSSVLQTKMSVFGQIKSELSALQDASQALVDATTWDSKSFASDAPTAVTGTVSTSAMAGTFKVAVTNLATVQALKFNAFNPAIDPTTNPLPAGTLTFQMGTWSGNAFANKKDATNVDVPSVSVEVKSTDTLATLASRINGSSAGVAAVVVTNGNTQQLILRGTNTGTNSGFQVTTSAGLEQFQYYSATSSIVQPTKGLLEAPTLATDATLTVEGIPVTSHSNTVVDAVPGVTLNLLTANSTANVTVVTDKDAIKTKIQAFQDAYNKLNADLKAQTKYDAATKTGGPLLGDGTTVGIQSMLRALVGSNGPAASTITRLSNLGLEIQADGSLSTNSTKLDAAMQDPANVKAFFATNTGTASSNGIAKRIYDFAFGANAVGGSVSSHSAAFQKSIDLNNVTIDKFNTHIADYQKQLLAQYTRLDTNMSKLNSLSTFVSQQVAQWNKTG